MERHVAIVGAGLAGVRAAETLREEGFDGRITLLGAEPGLPYDRPPLSKGFLTGQQDLASTRLHPQSWYDHQRVELRTGTRVTALDLGSQRLLLDGDEPLGFDALLLATGARARRLTGAGIGDEPLPAGVHVLRTREDAVALQQALAPGDRQVVVVGSGWIGLEVAAAARYYGNAVTVLGRDETPLAPVVGTELGQLFTALHADHGVRVRGRTTVRGLRRAAGEVRAVVLQDGTALPADVVVVGVGAEPADELAREAGLALGPRGGVAVDAALRSTHPAVWAAGDVASVRHALLGEPLRVDHWANAYDSAPVAARSLLGLPARHDLVPFFWTDQYDLGLEYSGFPHLAVHGELVVRGSLEARELIAFWLVAGRVVAGMNVNVWDVSPAIERLVRTGAPVDRARLTDPAVPLQDVPS